MSDIYESKTPFAFKQPCKSCGEEFEWQLSETHPRDACRECMRGGSSALVRQGERPLVKQGVIEPEKREEILSRLQELLMMASRPYVPRARTFSEWLSNTDPNAVERQAREFAGQQAKALMAARKELLELIRAETETEQIAFQAQLEARLAVMRAEVERLKLRRDAETLLAETEGIEGERYRRRIEEAFKVKALLEGPQTLERPKQTNPEIEKVRRKFSDRAEAEQAMIDDFRRKLVNIFWSDDYDDEEKALRIRSVLEVYNSGREALPESMRRLLDRVEKQVAL